jgi:hypothetical protein
MGNRGPLQTPFTEAIAPTASGAGDGGGTSGGFDLGEGSKSETPNSMSGLPAQKTTFSPGDGDPGINAQVPVGEISSPGTFHPGK